MEFQAEKGLWQGDPISLFLFIISVEGLVGLMKNANFQMDFHPFYLAKNLNFNLLQFADDILILGQASWEYLVY